MAACVSKAQPFRTSLHCLFACLIYVIYAKTRVPPPALSLGRKHQLRLHCSKVLGCPIVGDDAYDGGGEVSIALRKAGMFLNATAIAFEHPVYTDCTPHPPSECLHLEEDGSGGSRVWVKAAIPLPAPFQELVDGDSTALLSALCAKQVWKQGWKKNAEGVTICNYHNYGVCKMGAACTFDHTTCHRCLAAKHRAVDCTI